jgi:hypothetical protein
MMQQPGMTEDALEMQGQQAAPWPYSPFQMQPMQQRRPLESYLLIGAVVAAGLYLLNKSYKLDIQKRPDNIDRIDELLDAKTVKSSTKKVKSD